MRDNRFKFDASFSFRCILNVLIKIWIKITAVRHYALWVFKCPEPLRCLLKMIGLTPICVTNAANSLSDIQYKIPMPVYHILIYFSVKVNIYAKPRHKKITIFFIANQFDWLAFFALLQGWYCNVLTTISYLKRCYRFVQMILWYIRSVLKSLNLTKCPLCTVTSFSAIFNLFLGCTVETLRMWL